ncbi:hypothetical protein [Paludisphaera rhizosphaerae]|uniref:hypothetical protein n=1 Tax=Paludisphaera rhizosphaerae TaxID=2711216 RepID=UPI0013EA1A7E|nr:hypothetical protein [Paludisphaera rhizosphaerae]
MSESKCGCGSIFCGTEDVAVDVANDDVLDASRMTPEKLAAVKAAADGVAALVSAFRVLADEPAGKVQNRGRLAFTNLTGMRNVIESVLPAAAADILSGGRLQEAGDAYAACFKSVLVGACSLVVAGDFDAAAVAAEVLTMFGSIDPDKAAAAEKADRAKAKGRIRG